MKKLLNLSLILATSTLLSAASTSEELANEKCGSCHLMGKITKEKLNRMVAPPYWAMAKKANDKYTTRADRLNYLVDFALNPTEEKMLFPPETKERFGLMPSQKGIVSKEDITKIANYLLGEEE